MTTTTQLDNASLAQQHLGYVPGHDEETDQEMWRRFPYLHGWWMAARIAQDRYLDRWEQENGTEWTPMDGPAPKLPEYKALMKSYREMVEDIAAGGNGPGGDA